MAVFLGGGGRESGHLLSASCPGIQSSIHILSLYFTGEKDDHIKWKLKELTIKFNLRPHYFENPSLRLLFHPVDMTADFNPMIHNLMSFGLKPQVVLSCGQAKTEVFANKAVDTHGCSLIGSLGRCFS